MEKGKKVEMTVHMNWVELIDDDSLTLLTKLEGEVAEEEGEAVRAPVWNTPKPTPPPAEKEEDTWVTSKRRGKNPEISKRGNRNRNGDDFGGDERDGRYRGRRRGESGKTGRRKTKRDERPRKSNAGNGRNHQNRNMEGIKSNHK